MVFRNEKRNHGAYRGSPAESGLEITLRKITKEELRKNTRKEKPGENTETPGRKENPGGKKAGSPPPHCHEQTDSNDYTHLPGLRFEFYLASKLNEPDAKTGKITGGDRIYLHDEWMKLVRPSFSEKLYRGRALEFAGESELPGGFFISDLSLSDREVLDTYEKLFTETFDFQTRFKGGYAGQMGPEFFASMNDLLHAWKNASRPALTAALQYLYAEPTGLLYYLNAGSPGPLHFSAEKEKIVQSGEFSKALPLGMFQSDEMYSSNGRPASSFRQKLKENIHYLSPGDIFIMASDGFSEGICSSYHKTNTRSNYLSPQHVEEIIMQNKRATPTEIGRVLVREVESLDLKSDYSIIILKRPENAVVSPETLQENFPSYNKRIFTTK